MIPRLEIKIVREESRLWEKNTEKKKKGEGKEKYGKIDKQKIETNMI